MKITNQQTSSTPIQKLANLPVSQPNQSRRLLIIFAVIVALLGLVAYVGGNKSTSNPIKQSAPTPTPKRTLQPNPTETFVAIIQLSTAWGLDAKTYSNPKIEISFQYPNSFAKNEVDAVKENASFKQEYPEIKFAPYGDFFVSFYTLSPPIEQRQMTNFDSTSYEHNAMSLSVDVYNNTQNTSLEDFLKTHYSRFGPDGKTPTYETLKENLKPSNSPTTDSYVFVGSLGENPQKRIFFSYKNKFYIFTLQGGTGTGQKYSADAEKIFDQVIISIKFL